MARSEDCKSGTKFLQGALGRRAGGNRSPTSVLSPTAYLGGWGKGWPLGYHCILEAQGGLDKGGVRAKLPK